MPGNQGDIRYPQSFSGEIFKVTSQRQRARWNAVLSFNQEASRRFGQGKLGPGHKAERLTGYVQRQGCRGLRLSVSDRCTRAYYLENNDLTQYREISVEFTRVNTIFHCPWLPRVNMVPKHLTGDREIGRRESCGRQVKEIKQCSVHAPAPQNEYNH